MHKLIVTVALLIASTTAARAECTAASADRRVPLLELYTSEGCDSCPPADRWVSGLASRGVTAERAVVLAFHVDYWDRLGWTDRFGQSRFTQRQRELNDRNRSRVVYTPQLVLNGRDYRRGSEEEFAKRVGEINRERPRASIAFGVDARAGRVHVKGTASAPPEGRVWLALYENRLSSEVQAGENRGKRLDHDFVVRDLAGPYPAGTISHAFAVDKQWRRANVGVAAFVQDARSGDVLQALARDICT